MTSVVTRFAPSPTGFLHMGGVRTALFSFLYARQNKGTFALRIEDTDAARNKPEWTTGLVEDLKWLGLEHNVFVIQSERAPKHKEYLQKIIDEGKAYISKETPKEEGQRDEVIRFKNPNKVVVINDLIRGEVSIDTTDLGDFIIARSIDEPLYHFAVVADDFDMGITHVIRAEEHLSNTPRQILIQEAIGAPRPVYAHLPLVLAADKSKLSKRKHGETVWLTYYRSRGYLSAAIINFVALLGWNPGTEQEILSLDDLIAQFKLENVQKGGAVFNVEKLDWINREYIKLLTPEERTKLVREFAPAEISDDVLIKLESVIIDRISAFGEIKDLFAAGEFDYVLSEPVYEAEKLVWKAASKEETIEHLKKAIELLSNLPNEAIEANEAKELLWPYAEEKGRGNVLWPIRYALSGKDKSPDPFVCAGILGKAVTLKRLETGLQSLQNAL
ncbi:MAG: Glutamate--tRNA ligase [Patescibacteria group bacterium]|nr:Glutamate--tRNA ligase [Patescibacteria group bacterium]